MKDERRNYVIAGGFVVAMVAGLILWLALLSGRTGATDRYYILYENVASLTAGTEILYDGYRVGLIEGIGPVEHEGRVRFRVDVSVQRGWKIPEDSVAAIYTSGLLAPSVIQINGGESQTALAPGSRIASQEASDVFAIVGNLAQRMEPLIDSLSESAPRVLAQLDTFTAELDQTMGGIRELLKPENTQRVEGILAQLDGASRNVEDFTGEMAATLERMDSALGKVETLLDGEQGDLALALADLQHSLESVARHIDAINANLETTTRDMAEFSRQLREDPSVVLRGRERGEEPEEAQ